MTSANHTKFNRTYETFFPKMVQFATRLCRNKDEAEDVTQEAFIKAYKHFDQCEGTGVQNWLMRIVYHTFLDHRRKNLRRSVEVVYAPHDDFTIEDHADPTSNFTQEMFDGFLDPVLHKAIGSLDFSSRQLLSMAYGEQMSHREIGLKLGIRAESCRSRIHRICCRLRRDAEVKKLASKLVPIPV